MPPNRPHQPDEWDFFIAHASADKKEAEDLYAILSANSRAFLDSRCLLPGDNWDTELNKAQRRSRVTVVLISPHTDEAYYACEEIAAAIDMSRGEGSTHRVVPVYLERVRSEDVPYGLRRKQSLYLDSRGMQPVAASLMSLLGRLTGSPVDVASDELGSAQRLCASLTYEKSAKSRQVLKELHDVAAHGQLAVREAVIADLKEFLLDLDELRWSVLPPPVRDLRRSVLAVIRTAAAGGLARYFQHGEFEGIDLYGMDFRAENLCGVSFANCFLVEADFSGADLTNSSFVRASLRNVNLAGANLAGVDFTNADWFNAGGQSTAKLSQARRDTLIECPPDIDGMHSELKCRYALPFDEWSSRVQRQLLDAWQEYLRPGGLREITESWRRPAK